MGVNNLLDRVQARGVTSVTSEEKPDVTAKPTPVLTCTPVTSVTPEKNVTVRKIHANALDADAREYFAERAAIAEYDGGLRRVEAERQAARRVFEYMTDTDPGVWKLMLARPNDDICEVESGLKERFGEKHVLAVRPYQPAATPGKTP
jgi:hypothetical protein